MLQKVMFGNMIKRVNTGEANRRHGKFVTNFSRKCFYLEERTTCVVGFFSLAEEWYFSEAAVKRI